MFPFTTYAVTDMTCDSAPPVFLGLVQCSVPYARLGQDDWVPLYRVNVRNRTVLPHQFFDIKDDATIKKEHPATIQPINSQQRTYTNNITPWQEANNHQEAASPLGISGPSESSQRTPQAHGPRRPSETPSSTIGKASALVLSHSSRPTQIVTAPPRV